MMNPLYDPRAMLMICWLLAMLLICTFLVSFTTWWSDWQAATQNNSIVPLSSSLNNMQQLILRLPEQHLFGRSLQSLNDLPLTRAKIRLTGIIKSIGGLSDSKVFLSINDQPSHVYREGERVASSGIKVEKVTIDEVVIDNNGQLERLSLSRKPLEWHIVDDDNKREVK